MNKKAKRERQIARTMDDDSGRDPRVHRASAEESRPRDIDEMASENEYVRSAVAPRPSPQPRSWHAHSDDAWLRSGCRLRSEDGRPLTPAPVTEKLWTNMVLS